MLHGRPFLPLYPAALAFCACGAPEPAPIDAGVGITCTSASPSFVGQVVPILRGCSGAECHRGGWPYGALVNAPSQRDGCTTTRILVTPGSLEQSYLMNKLTGIGMCPGTLRMPFGGDALPAGEIQTIADWICAGAPND